MAETLTRTRETGGFKRVVQCVRLEALFLLIEKMATGDRQKLSKNSLVKTSLPAKSSQQV